MQFTWDEDKAVSNIAKHGVPFKAACAVFNDPFALELQDQERFYDEERYKIIGMVEGRLLLVVYAIRGETVRLISARGAEPFESRLYHEQVQ